MRDFVKYGKKIIAVGRNYQSHLNERLTSDIPKPSSEKNPFFFCLKPTTSFVQQPNPICLPVGVDSIFEHEVELGVIIGEVAGRNIQAKFAMNVVAGFCLAIDVTARTLQNEAANSGLPWSISKGFDTFCPVSEFIPKPNILDPHNLNLWLRVNNSLRQEVNTSEMLIKIPELIERISSLMRLERGDLILTGTPAGIGPINIGDIVTAGADKDFIRMMYRVVPGTVCRER